jgi:ABC-type nickel/cobalt efflux system permease component RcnA
MRRIKAVYGIALCLLSLPALASQTLTCISENNAFVRCGLSHADQRDIRIKSVKAGDCDANNAWGVDSSGIWVDKGCGAVFEYTQVASSDSSNSGNNSDGNMDIYIAPGFIGPYYGPGFYYGAGYYDYNGWDNDDYHHHDQDHEHHNEDHHGEHHGEGGFHGGGHGGGGRR